MSEFCGKCDVCDCYGDRSDEYLQNSRFFIYGKDGRDHQLVINNQKDLAKYYPYLVGAAGADKNKAFVHISSQCFIDSEEEEFIMSTYNEILRYYKQCKRKKIPCTIEDLHKKKRIIGWCREELDDWELELANRILKDGEKATIEGVHRPIHEYYRKRWYEYLVEIGYSECEARLWVYGWRRTWNERKEEESKSEDI